MTTVSRLSRMFFYKPFAPLHANVSQDTLPGEAELERIGDLLANSHWEESLTCSLDLINKSLEGLRYLQT